MSKFNEGTIGIGQSLVRITSKHLCCLLLHVRVQSRPVITRTSVTRIPI